MLLLNNNDIEVVVVSFAIVTLPAVSDDAVPVRPVPAPLKLLPETTPVAAIVVVAEIPPVVFNETALSAPPVFVNVIVVITDAIDMVPVGVVVVPTDG